MSSVYITSVHNTPIALLFHYLGIGRLEKWIPRVELISLNVATYMFNSEPAILKFFHSLLGEIHISKVKRSLR